MTRGKILSIILGIAFVVLLFAIAKSCRSGTPPANEREMLDETSYRASARSNAAGASDSSLPGFSS